ncbi:MAG: hypothetical protein ACTHLL_05320 [Candidatus Nitrosocosmicus sp.]
MILSKKDKELLVIKLLNEGLKYKDVAKQAHVSPSDISKIKRKITGEETETEKSLSLTSKSFQLFLEKKSLVEVAILLDISKDETIKVYSDFLALHNVGKVAEILIKYIKNLPAFLKWFNYIKETKTTKSEVARAIENIKQMDTLTQKKEQLEKEIKSIEEERNSCLRHYEYIKREINREIN